MAILETKPYSAIAEGVDFEEITLESLNKSLKFIQNLELKTCEKDPEDPNCDITGSLLSFCVADGYAYYIVTKQKPLTIAHVPCLDAYSVHPALIRGLNRDDVLEIIKMQRDLFRNIPKKNS